MLCWTRRRGTTKRVSIIYLDSSVALRTILDVPERSRLQEWTQAPDAEYVSSRLLGTEVIRVLRREGLPLGMSKPLLDRVGTLAITPETFTVAEAIEPHIKTLDALHVATALLVGEPVTIASHDTTMKSVAAHVGLSVVDPV